MSTCSGSVVYLKSWGQKIQNWGPLLDLTICVSSFGFHLYHSSSPLLCNKLVYVYPWVLWGVVANNQTKEGIMGTPIYRWSIKSTSVTWDLWLASEVGGQSCGTGPLPCGVWYYLQIVTTQDTQLVPEHCLVGGKPTALLSEMLRVCD